MQERGYKNGKQTKSGEFSGRLTPENNMRFDIYCKINNLNKTHELNRIVKSFLDEKYMKLKEE